MNAEINKEDQILSAIELKRIMIWQSPFVSIYDESKFKNYVTSEYRESKRKETDEVYRMFEFNLLHIASGLRLTLTTTESYDGNIVEYKVIRIFIITSLGKELNVPDANFENRIFYTTDSEIPFSEIKRY